MNAATDFVELKDGDAFAPGARDALDHIMSDVLPQGPGAVAAIIQADKVAAMTCAGLSHVANQTPFNSTTRARIASISKPMTAQVILHLAMQGILDLGSGVGRYLPDLPQSQGRVTLRQLLSMQSGLREEFALAYLALGDGASNDHCLRQRITLLDKQTTANFEPGTRTLYCNTNYTLLQRIAEKVTNKPFGQLLRDVVFEPAAMNSAAFGNRFATFNSGMGLAYQSVNGQFEPFEFLAESTAASGVIASLEDLVHWHLWNRAPGNVLWSATNERQFHNDGTSSCYGLGIEHKTLSGYATCGHAGGLHGWAMDYVFVPEADTALILIANRNDINWYERAREAMILYLGLKPDPTATPRLFRTDPPKPDWTETFGSEELGTSITFAGTEHELKFETRWMLRRADGTFCRSLGPEPFVFETMGADTRPPIAVKVREGNHQRVFVRRGTQASPDLSALTGVYVSDELPGRVVIVERDGRYDVSCGPDWPTSQSWEVRPITGGLFRAHDRKTGAGVDLHLLWPNADADPDRLEVSMTRLIRYPYRRIGGQRDALHALRFEPSAPTEKDWRP